MKFLILHFFYNSRIFAITAPQIQVWTMVRGDYTLSSSNTVFLHKFFLLKDATSNITSHWWYIILCVLVHSISMQLLNNAQLVCAALCGGETEFFMRPEPYLKVVHIKICERTLISFQAFPLMKCMLARLSLDGLYPLYEQANVRCILTTADLYRVEGRFRSSTRRAGCRGRKRVWP